jgi:orotate phosphoribosyltransferase
LLVPKKTYGTGQQVEGYIPEREDYVPFVDDVVTTGYSLRRMTKAMEPLAATSLGYVVAVNKMGRDREIDSLPVRTVFIPADFGEQT